MPFINIEPQALQDGWEISTPRAENMDSQALAQVYRDIYEEGELFQLRSLLVLRHGKLVAEAYLKDEDDLINSRPIWSCTKQIMGLLSGKAIEGGDIESIDDELGSYLPNGVVISSNKAQIKIKDLLSMRSGIDFDEVGDVSNLLQRKPENALEYILNLSMLGNPGEMFNYNSGDPHLLAVAIQQATSRPMQQWADETLFSKIGFSNYTWLMYNEYPFGGYGISTTPRELAKVAQLVLNKGSWQGEQLINEQWIEDMTSTQVLTKEGSDYFFGHLWWVNEKEGLYFMAGSGGQYAYILPNEDLLVVLMSEHDTDDELEIGFEQSLEIVKKIRATAK